MDTLAQTSRSTTPDSKADIQTTAQPRSKIIIQPGPLIEAKFYPVMDTPAALGWLGQVAALELHVPQWRIETETPGTSTTRHPDRVVFDLDPGPGAGLAECDEVALYLPERLARSASGSSLSPAVI